MCSLKKSERNPFFFSVLIWETFVIPLKRTAVIISLGIWRANCVNTVRVQSTLDVSEPFLHSVSTCVSGGSYHYLGAHLRCLDANWRGVRQQQREMLHTPGLWDAFSGPEMTQTNLESSFPLLVTFALHLLYFLVTGVHPTYQGCLMNQVKVHGLRKQRWEFPVTFDPTDDLTWWLHSDGNRQRRAELVSADELTKPMQQRGRTPWWALLRR